MSGCAGVAWFGIENESILGLQRRGDSGTFVGNQYPQDHPAHQYQLAYFRQMLGNELGPEFYFYSLSAASADNAASPRVVKIISGKRYPSAEAHAAGLYLY